MAFSSEERWAKTTDLGLFSHERAQRLKERGPGLGVAVRQIAGEGEGYKLKKDDEVTFTVPRGMALVEVIGAASESQGFWDAIDAPGDHLSASSIAATTTS